jgi:hypothetical protein
LSEEEEENRNQTNLLEETPSPTKSTEDPKTSL